MRQLFPDRQRLVDAGFIIVLGLVASFGLRDSFTGWGYLAAALAGLLLGVTLAHVADALRAPVVLVAVLALVAFFLLGGVVALHADGPLAMLPLPETLKQLADQLIHGWKDLLTTLAPVDGGPLLTVPYLMALVCGAGGMSLAIRLRSTLPAPLASIAHLAAVILLGVRSPERVVQLGAAFAVIVVCWVAIRSHRVRARRLAGGRWQRQALAALLVTAAGAGGMTLGPGLPYVDDHERVVFRNYVTPPFDIGLYPSPLASFRRYTKGYRAKEAEDRLWDKDLFTVEGLPAGSLVHLAALDDYDGVVWGAAAQSPGASGSQGSFQRVGTVIRDAGPGERRNVTVTIDEGYDEAWLPIAGRLIELHLTNEALEQRGEFFRYNLATATGVVPQGLEPGDVYSFTALVDDTPVSEDGEAGGGTPVSIRSSADFVPVAARWAPGAATPWQQVLGVAKYLQARGRYTDGGAGEEQYVAGHSVGRLTKFSAEGQQAAGNDEQYAAMLAVIANQLGVPARVVVGAKVPDDGVVRGQDMRAWVELQDATGTWRTLPTEQFMSKERPPLDQPPQPQDLVASEAIPPPAPVAPPVTAGDPYSNALNRKGDQRDDALGLSIPAWLIGIAKYAGIPLLGVIVVCGGIVLLKSRRRRRRRTRGSPATRLAGAWREAVDLARDLGRVTHALRTRREQAADLGLDALTPLAHRADAGVFGRDEPTDAQVAEIWDEVSELRSTVDAGLTRWQRLRAALSPASLRRLPRTEAAS